MTKNEFIEKIAKYVQKYAPQYGIAVCSPIIAQACLESTYGTSFKVKYHNYFGLKYRKNRVTCNNGYFYDGGSEQNSDGTYTNLPSDTAWYAFDNIEKGVEGYFQFINIPNYSNLKGVTDPLTYLQNIKADSYATSKDYVQNVYKVVTTYNLTKYDDLDNSIKAETDINKRKYRVAIDSGHGSNTGGKRHPDGYREHYSNTHTAYYLCQILEKNGFDVLKVSWNDFNATDDEDIALATRQSLVKKFAADISVSIHANAYGDGKSYNGANGVETFIHSNSDKAKDSKKLATYVQEELIKNTSQTNRGVKTNELAMCNANAMGTKASILVETAFMTNQREAQLLKSNNFMIECAKEIAAGIFKYFGISGNVNVSLTMGESSGSSNTTTENNSQNTNQNNTNTQSKPTTNSSSTSSSNKNNIYVDGDKYYYNDLEYSPVFNPNYYTLKYLDLQKAFGFNKEKLFEHFIKYGMKEGRQAAVGFNVIVYKNNNADLRKAFGEDLPSYFKHYLIYGKNEGRKTK